MEKRFEIPQGANPIADCSGLIPAWVHNSHDLNRVEAENILKAQKKYLKSSHPKNWFQPEELKTIHQAMFKDVWNWAGIYRKSITSIGVKPGLIPTRLGELCFEVNSWWENPPQLTFTEMAARIHHQLVSIHPFENGNGRFSRLVADRFLLSWKCPYPLWPQHLNQEGVKRKDFIHSLKLADKGDYSSLVALMKQLGASDPKLSELMRDNFYHAFMHTGGMSIIKALIENGANPDDETHNGYRVLQLAIKAGFDLIAQTLVEQGADVNATDRSGLTPFQTAVVQSNKSLADFLISKGAKRLALPGIGYVQYSSLPRIAKKRNLKIAWQKIKV